MARVKLGRPAKHKKESIEVAKQKVAQGVRKQLGRCYECETTGPCYVGCPGDGAIQTTKDADEALLQGEGMLLKEGEMLAEIELAAILHDYFNYRKK